MSGVFLAASDLNLAGNSSPYCIGIGNTATASCQREYIILYHVPVRCACSIRTGYSYGCLNNMVMVYGLNFIHYGGLQVQAVGFSFLQHPLKLLYSKKVAYS